MYEVFSHQISILTGEIFYYTIVSLSQNTPPRALEIISRGYGFLCTFLQTKLEHSCQECWPLQHCFISLTINNTFNPSYSNINPKLSIQYFILLSDWGTQLHCLSFGILHKQEYNIQLL